MKVVTANRLQDGRVVYLDASLRFVDAIEDAMRLDADNAAHALEVAAAREREVADPYLIEIDEAGLPAGREALRENIRRNGPTVSAGPAGNGARR